MNRRSESVQSEMKLQQKYLQFFPKKIETNKQLIQDRQWQQSIHVTQQLDKYHNSFNENTQEKSAAQNNLPRRVLLKIVS